MVSREGTAEWTSSPDDIIEALRDLKLRMACVEEVLGDAAAEHAREKDELSVERALLKDRLFALQSQPQKDSAVPLDVLQEHLAKSEKKMHDYLSTALAAHAERVEQEIAAVIAKSALTETAQKNVTASLTTLRQRAMASDERSDIFEQSMREAAEQRLRDVETWRSAANRGEHTGAVVQTDSDMKDLAPELLDAHLEGFHHQIEVVQCRVSALEALLERPVSPQSLRHRVGLPMSLSPKRRQVDGFRDVASMSPTRSPSCDDFECPWVPKEDLEIPFSPTFLGFKPMKLGMHFSKAECRSSSRRRSPSCCRRHL